MGKRVRMGVAAAMYEDNKPVLPTWAVGASHGYSERGCARFMMHCIINHLRCAG
jgi:hypothetical protein